MQSIFDDSLVISFQEVVEESLTEFFVEDNLTSFQLLQSNKEKTSVMPLGKRIQRFFIFLGVLYILEFLFAINGSVSIKLL